MELKRRKNLESILMMKSPVRASQQWLSSKTGISISAICGFVTGARNPNHRQHDLICRALGVSWEWYDKIEEV